MKEKRGLGCIAPRRNRTAEEGENALIMAHYYQRDEIQGDSGFHR